MNRMQFAEYVAEIAAGLARLAARARLNDLAVLLQMVAQEATNTATRESG